jgi:ubiquinone/menaquinone biosynthesis C-methylase UbiE/protein-S-isoprenylcysteine O-methyltransferase Ste14
MTNELRQDGAWLLRYRWIMPLTLLPLAILAASQADIDAAHHIGRSLRDGWEILCLAIALAGWVIRALTIGFSDKGASRRAEDAHQPTGMNSIVRYPLYLGTYVSLLGLSLLPGTLWLPFATSVVFFLWYGRLVHQSDLALTRSGGTTRAPLLLPNPFLWRRPAESFSLGRALRHEQNDFYFVVAGFVGLELACDLLGEDLTFGQWLSEDLHWALLLIVGTLIFLALRRRNEAAMQAGGAELLASGPSTRGLRVDRRLRSVDILENLISFGHLQRILDATIDAARLSQGDRLLDVGCGTGKLAIQAATLADGHSVGALGIDATPGMIALARENARLARSRAEFRVGVGEALPVADASFDAVTSSYFLHHLPSDVKRKAILEMWRALRPGGRLVITDYGRPTGMVGQVAAFPMRFNFHEYVRGQLAGELEAIVAEERLGTIEHLHSFLGYINVMRLVKYRSSQ